MRSPKVQIQKKLLFGRLADLVLICTLATFCAVFIAWPVGCFIWQVVVDGGAAKVATVIADNLPVFLNSAFVGVLTSLISCVIALCVALVLEFGSHLWTKVVGALVTVSMISPPFVASLAYIELFGRRGLITHGLLSLSISPYGWQGIVLMQSLFFAAINVVMLKSVLDRVDRDAVCAALDLGAPMGRVFIDVMLPLLRPALAVCLLLTFVRSVSDYGTPVVIGGKFETIATQIYVRVVGYSDLGSAAVLNLVLFCFSVVAYALYRRLGSMSIASSSTLSGSEAQADGETGFRLDGALGFSAYGVSALFSAFLLLLYGAIIHAAFTKGIGLSAPFTLDNLTHLVEFNLETIARSVRYSLFSAVVSTALGLFSAYYAHRRRLLGSSILDFLTTLPYAIPGLCLGLGYVLAFNRPPLELVGTGTIIVMVLASKEIAVSARAFAAALSQIPAELDLAARDLGASGPRVLVGVLIPNLREAVGVSLVNGFSSAMVAYAAVLFLIAPGHKTAIFELFDALSGGKYGEAAMISLVLIVITTMVNALFHRLLLVRRSRHVS